MRARTYVSTRRSRASPAGTWPFSSRRVIQCSRLSRLTGDPSVVRHPGTSGGARDVLSFTSSSARATPQLALRVNVGENYGIALRVHLVNGIRAHQCGTAVLPPPVVAAAD